LEDVCSFDLHASYFLFHGKNQARRIEMSIKETCHCGSVEFTLQNDPMMHFACHCSDCQKIWGNSFFGYAYSTDDICITGEVKKYSYEGGSGNQLHYVFCPECGSKIHSQPDLIEGMIYIPCGMLKKHYEFEPKVELFSSNKAPCFAQVKATAESYEHNGTIERIGELLENLEQR
jgi:hypothetical protein